MEPLFHVCRQPALADQHLARLLAPRDGDLQIELLSNTFIGRSSDRLTAPDEVCLPVPCTVAPERLGLAVKRRLDPNGTILATTLKEGLVCSQSTRVSWLTLALAPDE